eukprot:scaffold137409_cov23-Tisochrysis_lutea.AAC.1
MNKHLRCGKHPARDRRTGKKLRRRMGKETTMLDLHMAFIQASTLAYLHPGCLTLLHPRLHTCKTYFPGTMLDLNTNTHT